MSFVARPVRPSAPPPRGRRRSGMWGALVVVLVLVAGCAGTDVRTADGVVVAVEGSGLGGVKAFTIRAPGGGEQRIEVGDLDLSGGAFPADHLREHLLTGQPVAVGYRLADGRRIAYRLVDAPWLQSSP